MTRPEVTGRKLPGVDACSISEFCTRHNISVAHFYRLRSEGKAPALMKVGSRILISREAAERWRRAREQEAATAAI
jgi:hypothetical protein